MKYPVLAALAVAVASLHAADEAKPATPAAVPSPAAQPKMLTPEQQKQAFYLQGFFLAGQTPLPQITSQLELSDEELDQVIAGMRAAVKGEQPKVKPDDALIAGAEKFFAERVAGKSKRWATQNEAFLAKVDADKDVVKSPSGLRYKIVTPGTDPKPVATSTVKCRYTGKLVDGKVFDSTANRGNKPDSCRQFLPGMLAGMLVDKDPAAATDLMRRAVAGAPERVRFRLNLARLLARDGRSAEAAASLRAALALRPTAAERAEAEEALAMIGPPGPARRRP
jgi:Flp pilus assembly protein TadD